MSDVTRVFNPEPVDRGILDQLEAQRTRSAVLRAQATPTTATGLGALRQRYPWMSAGTALALAKAGYGPDDPAAQAAANAEADQKAKTASSGGWGVIGEVVKPVVRTVALAGQSLYEEAEGAVRNVAAAGPAGAAVAGAGVGAALGSIIPGLGTAVGAGAGAAVGAGLGLLASHEIEGHGKWESQSTGGVVLGKLVNGEHVALGSGFIPHPTPDIVAEQKRRADRVTVGGRYSLTPGRLLAAGITEPGTKPFNTLSGLADGSLALSRYDPSTFLLHQVGEANKARKLLVDSTGAVEGLRNTVLATKAEEWWAGATGRKLAQALAGESSFDTIWRATGKKLDVATALELSKADTVDKVDEILRPKLGVDIREKFGYSTFRPTEYIRFLQPGVPGHSIDITNPDAAVEGIDRYLKNAKVDPATIAGITGRLAEATAGSSPGLGRPAAYQALADAMDAVAGQVADKTGEPARAERLTRFFMDRLDDVRHYFIDEVGNDMQVPGVVLGGQAHDLAHPHLFVEYLNSKVPLPDFREIRRATSALSPLVDTEGWKRAVTVLDGAQDIWKRLTLLRGAYTARVIGEEQARMAAAGLDSMFAHPLSFIAWRLGRKSDVLGNEFDHPDAFVNGVDAFGKAMTREWGGWIDKSEVATKNIVRIKQGETGFGKAWAGELLQLSRDPVAREVALADNGLDAVKQAFWDGKLSWARKDMAADAPGLLDAATANDYIDSIAHRIEVKTGGDPDLLDAVRTGKLAGQPLLSNERIAPAFVDLLGHYDYAAPEVVKGDQLVHVGKPRSVVDTYDNVTGYLFSKLMGERTNNLSRSPTFRQFYWQRIEELMPRLAEDAQAAVLDAADKAGLDKATLGRLADRTAASGDVTLEHADTVAKGFGLDSTKNLLHDLTDKGQFMDAARLVFPFGEAWKQVLTKWARIGIDNPAIPLRRLPQIVEGARGAGFFRTNDQGEEVFTYPMSEMATKAVLGVPIPLVGRVAGLSLLSEVLPGVGPSVSIPAGWFLPDKPDFDGVRNVVFPMGEPDQSHGLAESLLPAWVQKFRQVSGTPADQRLFNNTVMDVARYLASTGKYDTTTTDGIISLLDDAKLKAKGLYAIRGTSQFFSPSAPSPEFLAADKTGHLLVAQQVLDDFHRMQQENFDTAVDRFLGKYGPDAYLLMQGKSNTVTDAPVTTDGADWERAHPDVVRRYPNVFGFFAPSTGTFDYTAYQRQLANGSRQPLTPDQFVQLANARIGAWLYNQAKDQVGDHPNAAQQKQLRDYKTALIADYPGYQVRAGITERADTPTLVRELSRAAADPRLADAPGVDSLRAYLMARDRAQAAASSAGLASFSTSKSAAGTRAWLAGIGKQLAAADPEFAQMWDRVFSRELPDDAAEEAPAP